MDSDLNFTCAPGDLILARSRALRMGPARFSPDNYYRGWNRLGDNDLFRWNTITDEHLSPCTVITVVRFPEEASSLNYLTVLVEGCLAYLFDDPEHGFWVPIDLKAQSARFTRAWMNSRKLGRISTVTWRAPRARG
jgi:hypothetical protein